MKKICLFLFVSILFATIVFVGCQMTDREMGSVVYNDDSLSGEQYALDDIVYELTSGSGYVNNQEPEPGQEQLTQLVSTAGGAWSTFEYTQFGIPKQEITLDCYLKFTDANAKYLKIYFEDNTALYHKFEPAHDQILFHDATNGYTSTYPGIALNVYHHLESEVTQISVNQKTWKVYWNDSLILNKTVNSNVKTNRLMLAIYGSNEWFVADTAIISPNVFELSSGSGSVNEQTPEPGQESLIQLVSTAAAGTWSTFEHTQFGLPKQEVTLDCYLKFTEANTKYLKIYFEDNTALYHKFEPEHDQILFHDATNGYTSTYPGITLNVYHHLRSEATQISENQKSWKVYWNDSLILNKTINSSEKANRLLLAIYGSHEWFVADTSVEDGA